MRPRSRLPPKQTLLLPTITEGTEELAREMNDANADRGRPVGSSEDYLLSICHLAHPTFPTRDLTSHSNRDGKIGCYGDADPLEHIYGHPNCSLQCGRRRSTSKERTRAHSVPNTSTPDLTQQRKRSCPELHNATRTGPKTTDATEEERPHPAVKPSLISQWISDCRAAWRETRARACLLPAIAEI
ncbi:uncharacterized protein si:dkeyp-72g9.4 [Periophthalmus magnuspinnatus]|uniref:uncharacterized protein si:dkeyp-72g9.4 n=1 Tax=Periophthalmus magnuspinnatus TaxID=409849 RepID=UPI00145B9BA3|nr:uncharacterized protein si:dkeyp-72g9.4 [Periophthalmus magnuspinnatus]